MLLHFDLMTFLIDTWSLVAGCEPSVLWNALQRLANAVCCITLLLIFRKMECPLLLTRANTNLADFCQSDTELLFLNCVGDNDILLM